MSICSASMKVYCESHTELKITIAKTDATKPRIKFILESKTFIDYKSKTEFLFVYNKSFNFIKKAKVK